MDPGLLLSKALALPFGIAAGVGTVVLLLEFILVLVVLVLLVPTAAFGGTVAAAGCPLVKESDSSPRCKLSGSDSRRVLVVAVPIFREGSVPTFPTD